MPDLPPKDPPPQPPSKRPRNLATGVFVLGFLLFWTGGLGSCAGLSGALLMLTSPVILVVGLGLQLAGIVFLVIGWVKKRVGDIGCLLSALVAAFILAVLFLLLSILITIP